MAFLVQDPDKDHLSLHTALAHQQVPLPEVTEALKRIKFSRSMHLPVLWELLLTHQKKDL